MFVVIVGCSEVGYYLARALVSSGHEVAVIENDPQRCQFLTDGPGIVALQGDGTDTAVLRRAGAERADVVVALTGADATNMVICQTVQHVFKTPESEIPRTMTLVKDPKNEPVFVELGIDVVINWINLARSALEEGVPGHPLRHLMSLRRPGAELVCVAIPGDADIVGKQISELERELPPGNFISLLVKRGGAVPPAPHQLVEAEDELIVVTSGDYEQELYDILTGA